MVDTWLDVKADRHTCGRPLSESLKDPDKPNPEYQVAEEVCLACMAYDKFRAAQEKTDEPLRAQGRHPESYRIHTILPLAEIPAEAKEAIRAKRNT